jgi:hypothetical protein
MVWTAPVTWVDSNVLTAGELNTFLRDDMLETMPAKATAALQHFVGAGPNAINSRQIGTSVIETTESTSSTSYVDLTTPGPSVTATTGTQALVFWSAYMENADQSAGDNSTSYMSIDVSGATTTAAADNIALRALTAFNHNQSAGMSHLFALTSGSNTFTVKYKTSGTTSKFNRRQLIVIPF